MFVGRQGRNEKIVDTFFTNAGIRTMILGALLDDVYLKANAPQPTEYNLSG